MEKGIDCEVEFAVDETDYPTKPAEHIVVVSELQRLGMDFVSFAPRFVGRFEKGVEYIGDIDELQRDFEIHAEIARALGPYKLSLHSGSDKYSTYPLIAEATKGLVHLKTAGTSWAEALRVIAHNDPDLMREVLALALDSFEANRKSYHLSCDPTRIPTDPTDDEVAQLMDLVDSRQVLHVGYGAILEEFGTRMYQVWNDNEEEHYRIIADHFVKHLTPFAPYAPVGREPTRLGAPVGLFGQVVRQIDGGLDCLVQAEPMLQDQTREIAGIDATEEVVPSRYRCERPRVVHEARGVVEARRLGGRLPEPAHALGESRNHQGHPVEPKDRCRRSEPAHGYTPSRRR